MKMTRQEKKWIIVGLEMHQLGFSFPMSEEDSDHQGNVEDSTR